MANNHPRNVRCAECDRWFRTKHPTKKYCSKPCFKAVRLRERKAYNKAHPEQHKEGNRKWRLGKMPPIPDEVIEKARAAYEKYTLDPASVDGMRQALEAVRGDIRARLTIF